MTGLSNASRRALRGLLWVGAAIAIGACLGVARAADAADAVEALAADYRYCTLCHGANGNGNAAIRAPTLAGIEPWYLLAQLEAYRERRRGASFATDPAGAEMAAVAREIGPGRHEAIARYVAGLPRERPAPLAPPTGNAASGRRLYAQHCAACHGARAEGNQALQAPSLDRLDDWYLADSYEKYRSGARGGPTDTAAAQVMRAALAAVPAELPLADVVRFLNELPPPRTRSPSSP